MSQPRGATGLDGCVAQVTRVVGGRDISVLDAVLRSDKKKTAHIMVQIAMQVGGLIDDTFAEMVGDGDVLRRATEERRSKASAVKLGKMAKAMERKIRGDEKTRLCRYYFAGRRQNEKHATLSISLDAARLGRRLCLIGCTLAGDTLMWGPPQALAF